MTAAPIYHAALPADWRAAQAAGVYAVSTRGRALAEEGFIHASYEHQVEGVANAFYADIDELVLLEIDRDALGVDVVDESPTGNQGDEQFPHIYGPIAATAVLDARAWTRDGDGWHLPESRPGR